MDIKEIREKIAEKLYKQRWYEGQLSWENSQLKQIFRNYASQILNTEIVPERECDKCEGSERQINGEWIERICPHCGNEGVLPPITVEQVLKERLK